MVVRLRRPPLGRADLPRPRRARRRLEPRRADPARSASRGPSCSTGGRPGPAASSTRRRVLLEPLAAEETDELIERLLGDAGLDETLARADRRGRGGQPALRRADAGAWSPESPNGDVVVPPTIQALLAARLDQLDAAERGVLERGAVEGKIFHRGGVEALAPEEHDVPTQADGARPQGARAARTGRSCPATTPSASAICSSATPRTTRLPKAARAELHERFAEWLEGHGADLIELDEILGYHLEQAHRYRVELGLGGEETDELAGIERQSGSPRRASVPSSVTTTPPRLRYSGGPSVSCRSTSGRWGS